MELPVYNMSGEQVSTHTLPAGIFEANINRALMHQALVRQMANARLGTHKAKTRSEVSRSHFRWRWQGPRPAAAQVHQGHAAQDAPRRPVLGAVG